MGPRGFSVSAWSPSELVPAIRKTWIEDECMIVGESDQPEHPDIQNTQTGWCPGMFLMLLDFLVQPGCVSIFNISSLYPFWSAGGETSQRPRLLESSFLSAQNQNQVCSMILALKGPLVGDNTVLTSGVILCGQEEGLGHHEFLVLMENDARLMPWR